MSSSEEYLDSLLQSATREIEEVKGESLLEESLSQESPLEEVVSATDAISGVAEEEVSDVSVEEVSDVAVAKASAEEINADEIDTLMAILESKPESPKQESPKQEDIKPVDHRQEVSAEELQEIEQLQAMRQSLSNAASDHEDVVTILEGMDEDSELGEISSLLKKSDSHELVSDDLISSLLQTEEELMAAPNPKREELATPPNKTSEAEAPKQKDKKKKKVADAVTSDVLGIQEVNDKSKKPWWKKLVSSRKDKKEADSSVPVQDLDATFLELDELDAHLVTPDGKNSTASSKSRVIVKEEDNIQTKSESKKPKKSFLSLLFDEEPEEQDKNAAPGAGESDDGINLPEKPDKSSKKSKKKDKKGKDAGKSNEDILEEMDGEDVASAKGKKGKDKKKKEKAPKKKLKILDDAPAEPVRPLSKKVIRGMVAMVAAVLSLILISAYYLPGMVEVIKAKAIYYNEADYVSAYQMLYNHKLGESDQILFEKATILAALQIRQDRYEQYEKQGEPLYAADVLLSMLSYAANVSESAESLGIIEQVEEYRQEAEAVLLDMYGFSEEDILRVQAIEADDAYTYELTQILFGDTREEMDETVDPVGENQEQLPDPLPGEEELIEQWNEEESQEIQEVESSPISQEDPLPGEEGLWNIQGETQE